MLGLSSAQVANLETHVKFKGSNLGWLHECVQGQEKSFPYITADKGDKTIYPQTVEPLIQTVNFPTNSMDTQATYLINVPMGFGSLVKNPNLVTDLLKLFSEESFGLNAAQSIPLSEKELAVVFGINSFYSLDSEKNRNFEAVIQGLNPITTVASRIFGFYWAVNYEPKLPIQKNIYRPSQAFTILKMLSPQTAQRVLENIEGKDKLHPNLLAQIPYGLIRETIKNHLYSAQFDGHFQTHSPNAPTYFSIIDSDTLGLRIGQGLYSRVDDIVLKGAIPSVISFGYQLESDELPLLQIGVKLDMVAREAMNKVIPYSPYFPEPGLFVLSRIPTMPSKLKDLTFRNTTGLGLESRRLIQNGLKSKTIRKDSLFSSVGGLITGTPLRMFTEKNQTYDELSQKDLKSKACLQALRNISQSHIFPKSWADNLYLALGFKCPEVTKATTPMMHIFSVYDPISRMFAGDDRYSKKKFDHVMTNFDKALDENAKDVLQSARGVLLSLGIPKEIIDKIELAAKETGKAVHKALKEELDQLD